MLVPHPPGAGCMHLLCNDSLTEAQWLHQYVTGEETEAQGSGPRKSGSRILTSPNRESLNCIFGKVWLSGVTWGYSHTL